MHATAYRDCGGGVEQQAQRHAAASATSGRPARRSARASSRRLNERRSSATSAVFVEQLADFGELRRRGLAGRQRLQHQLGRRPVEDAVEQVGDELLLRLRLGRRRLVDVRARALVAARRAPCRS